MQTLNPDVQHHQSPKGKKYAWTGIGAENQWAHGEIIALNRSTAKRQLREQGVRLRSIQLSDRPKWRRQRKVSDEDIVMFFRQLSTMMTANITMSL